MGIRENLIDIAHRLAHHPVETMVASAHAMHFGSLFVGAHHIYELSGGVLFMITVVFLILGREE
jgi:hypothetical protein